MKKWILFFLVCCLSPPIILAQTGNVGINTITPQARIHAVRNNTSGGPLLTNALAIFEDNQNSFIHLSHTNTTETGILSGNQNTLIRSGLIFGLDSSILFRAGGNFNRMAIKNGRVGINTISPAAMLHVKDGSVLFAGPLTFPGSSDPPVSGAGTRIMWYADKAALRAGRVTGTDWDKDSIGLYSFATGINTRALGESSVAMGEQTVASGWFSTSLGFVSQASGLASTSLGLGTIASGGSSIALGSYTNAVGASSAAFGNTTTADGFCSTAFGRLTYASGENATAFGHVNQSLGHQSMTMGFLTTAKGDNSTAMGQGTFAKPFASLVIGQYNDTTAVSATLWDPLDPVFIIGKGSADNARANAVTVLKNGRTGINTISPLAMLHVKDSSVVFTALGALPPVPGNPPVSDAGTRFMWYPEKAALRAGRVISTQWNRDSIGTHSTAFGLNTQAKGSNSMAVGFGAKANGNNAMSFGQGTVASGENSIALGITTYASGNTSFASGGDTKASGSYSSAFGYGGMASGNSAIATGSSTKETALNATSMGFVTAARGENATSMGYLTIARSFASLTIGRYNDTTNMTNLNSWIATDPVFVIGNGVDESSRSNALTVLKNGKSGINTTTPDAMLHVVKDVPTNGPYNTNAAAIFEGDQGSFIQLSNNNSIQSGILSGNELTSLRSALIFTADSSVQIRAGGNNTKLFVRHDGHTGIGTLSPQKLLHVSGGSSGATATTSAIAVMEDNTDVSINLLSPDAQSTAIYFGNTTNAVHGGIVYNSPSTNGLAFRTNGNVTRAVLNSAGDMGIGDNSPDARLHVSEGAGGSIYNTNAEVIIEDNDATYLQFSSPTIEESGILSGNAVASLRSALIFRPDSSVQIRAGGSTTRLAVTKSGNTGIGTLTPEAKLDVNGTTKLGTNGTAITEIIKLTILSDAPNVPANSTATENFAVPDSEVNSTVFVSPGSNLDPGLVIAYARVTAPGNVAVKFTNTTGAAINPPAMNYYITVIR